MTTIPAVAAALRPWSLGLYFPPWPADCDPLAPWLGPDGREWGARRLRRPPRVPADQTAPNLLLPPGMYLVPPRRTPISRVVRHLVAEVGAAPLGRSAIWAIYRYDWH